MSTPWIQFVMKLHKAHPKLTFKQCLKKASPLWKKANKQLKGKGKAVKSVMPTPNKFKLQPIGINPKTR